MALKFHLQFRIQFGEDFFVQFKHIHIYMLSCLLLLFLQTTITIPELVVLFPTSSWFSLLKDRDRETQSHTSIIEMSLHLEQMN